MCWWYELVVFLVLVYLVMCGWHKLVGFLVFRKWRDGVTLVFLAHAWGLRQDSAELEKKVIPSHFEFFLSLQNTQNCSQSTISCVPHNDWAVLASEVLFCAGVSLFWWHAGLDNCTHPPPQHGHVPTHSTRAAHNNPLWSEDSPNCVLQPLVYFTATVVTIRWYGKDQNWMEPINSFFNVCFMCFFSWLSACSFELDNANTQNIECQDSQDMSWGLRLHL